MERLIICQISELRHLVISMHLRIRNMHTILTAIPMILLHLEMTIN